MRAETFPTLSRAVPLLLDPCCLRACWRWAFASRTRSARSWRRFGTFSPVDSVNKVVIPASTPTLRPLAARVVVVSWTRIDTCQRPALSTDAVTVDGSAPSGRGRDHTMSNGWLIFARVNWPPLNRNPDRLYSAHARDFRFDLNRG